MSVLLCGAKSSKFEDVCAWVFTCACRQFRSGEFATYAEAHSAFIALHEGEGIPAHLDDYCLGVVGGGVEPAHSGWGSCGEED